MTSSAVKSQSSSRNRAGGKFYRVSGVLRRSAVTGRYSVPQSHKPAPKVVAVLSMKD